MILKSSITRPLLCAALILALAWGCAGPGLRLTGQKGVLEPNRIIELKTGQDLTPGELTAGLALAGIVFIGEMHRHPLQHRHQLEIIKGLWERNRNLVLGLEVFARPRQDLLDRWVAGKMKEHEFKEKLQDGILNRSTLEVYFALLDWAREKQVPILALNAPRAVAAQVARSGLAGLTEKQRRNTAKDIRLGPEAYKQRVGRAFHGHATAGGLDNFFAAQVVWDETMAETLTDYLSSEAGQGRRAVVICGNEHIFYGYGVPNRVARRWSGSQARLLMLVSSDDETLTPKAADFVWVTRPAPPVKRLRLGVGLKTSTSGELIVDLVVPGSEAGRIGLEPGDKLLKMDGRPLNSFMDLHRAAVADGPDREHDLTVDREGRVLKFKFHFREE
ncbi:MAG: ChaN family lipoprotein [Thermodesulfobacteriota bacterium]|nr:ChaN family lipoprotein [Thermodesulfobacteriota bacterium]